MDKGSPSPAAWQRLYELASEVHALAPWTWMDEGMVFGVRSGDSEEPHFVSVMGQAGQHLAVAVYLGLEGLRGFREMSLREAPSVEQLLEVPNLQASFEDLGELEAEDLAIVKELGLSFRGRNAWPLFRCFRPGFCPWFIEAWEADVLANVLEQVLELAPRVRQDPSVLGPGDGRTFLVRMEAGGSGAAAWAEHSETILLPAAVPVAAPVDGGAVKRLRRLARGDHPVEVSLFASMATIQAGRERPRNPYVLLVVDSVTGMVLGADVLEVETDLQAMLARVPEQLCGVLERAGQVPGEMRTDSARLMGLVEALASELEMRVELVPDLPFVEEVKEGLEEHVFVGPEPGPRKPPAAADPGSGGERGVRRAAGVSTGTRVGRNEPCPCGSGKKYKKCCLPAEQGRGGELTP